MSLDFILLGMLRTPASGYELKRSFAEGPRRFWSAELSQIYPALQKMQRRGWLSSRREPSPRGPERRVYSRTKKGVRVLHDWLRDEPALGAERFAYIGQLIFHGELDDPPCTLHFLEKLRASLAASAARLAEGGNDPSAAGRGANAPDAHEFHEHLCLTFGRHALRGRIAACDECIALVSQRLAGRPRRKESPDARSRRRA